VEWLSSKIAEALEAANERSIFHRDLKPSNVKVTDDGTDKVLTSDLRKSSLMNTNRTLLAFTNTTLSDIGDLGTSAYMSLFTLKASNSFRISLYLMWTLGGHGS
jgi:serine/threonine protein kinase